MNLDIPLSAQEQAILDRVEARLEELGLSEAEFARRLYGPDTPQSRVSNWKRRGRIPWEALPKVAKGLEISLDELCGDATEAPLLEDDIAECAENLRISWEEAKNTGQIRSQEQVALALGMSQGAIWQYLTGKQKVGLRMAFLFGEILGCDPRDISPEARRVARTLGQLRDSSPTLPGLRPLRRPGSTGESRLLVSVPPAAAVALDKLVATGLFGECREDVAHFLLTRVISDMYGDGSMEKLTGRGSKPTE